MLRKGRRAFSLPKELPPTRTDASFDGSRTVLGIIMIKLTKTDIMSGRDESLDDQPTLRVNDAVNTPSDDSNLGHLQTAHVE